MHKHSLDVWLSSQTLFKGRRKAVLEVVAANYPEPVTAREVSQKLFPWSDDLNKVRPRLTELKGMGFVDEVGESVEGGVRVALYGLGKEVGRQILAQSRAQCDEVETQLGLGLEVE